MSVPVLLKRIEHRLAESKKSKFPRVDDLVAHLRQIERRHADRGIDVRSSEIDPMLDELAPFMNPKPVEDLIRETTLVNVLYSLRNSRIHAMRNLGGAVELWVNVTDEPVYQGIQKIRGHVAHKTALHLTFHEQFVASLLRAGVVSLRAFILEKGVDPYDLLRETSAWELKSWTPFKAWDTP